MSDIGPALPPHLLAKRKRQQEEEAKDASEESPGAKPPASPPDGEKRRRIAGPAMPPAPLDERPAEPANAASDSDSDDDDDFGPALPSSGDHATATVVHDNDDHLRATEAEAKPRRDAWMMIPPKQDDLAARMDPTKQRARGFNTGKGASASGGGDVDASSWYETPEQKKKRLADEMMGVAKPTAIGPSKPAKGSSGQESEATRRKVDAHTEKTRGPSLMEQHEKSTTKEAEDDPSARAFDREKDMATGGRIGHSQRKELLGKAANFSSKFSGGSYL